MTVMGLVDDEDPDAVGLKTYYLDEMAMAL